MSFQHVFNIMINLNHDLVSVFNLGVNSCFCTKNVLPLWMLSSHLSTPAKQPIEKSLRTPMSAVYLFEVMCSLIIMDGRIHLYPCCGTTLRLQCFKGTGIQKSIEISCMQPLFHLTWRISSCVVFVWLLWEEFICCSTLQASYIDAECSHLIESPGMNLLKVSFVHVILFQSAFKFSNYLPVPPINECIVCALVLNLSCGDIGYSAILVLQWLAT